MRAPILYVILCGLIMCYGSSSWAFVPPRAKLTVKVVDEEGAPVAGARVGIGFERNTGWGTKEIPVVGFTDETGVLTGSAFALDHVGYRVEKEGYYQSFGEFTFDKKKLGRWLPWNPILDVLVRRIKDPVPMYARNTQISGLEIPIVERPVGFDLIKYDWVSPFGHGEFSDFVFMLEREYKNDHDFTVSLAISFSNPDDGVIALTEGLYKDSVLAHPRYAPQSGYRRELVLTANRTPGSTVSRGSHKADNYAFRVRSKRTNGDTLRAMYGLIKGRILLEPRGRQTATVLFTYFLNPDYTRNLEFGENLFKDLPERERVWIGQ